MTTDEPRWLRREAILSIHARQLAEHGGMPGVRDEGLLDAALARPLQIWSYESPPPDTARLAAAYAWAILRNHPFADGNKRTAYIAMRSFLIANDMDVTASLEERYLTMLAAAAGEIDESTFVAWVRANSAPAS